ncbi:MAG: hypothetical protein C3F02_01525 [Parcubacteria group bacterium]|nr:MAG: hypothetical protein C3F02_01525 [Parcubacteria group bacterium]
MFLTTHAAAALYVGTQVHDPLLALAIGFASHFVMDAVPHGDETLGSHHITTRGKYFYLAKVAFVDLFLAGSLVFFYMHRRPEVDRLVVAAAAFGSWLPDFLWLANRLLKIKILTFYTRMHDRIHELINWQFSPVYGVPFQIIITILFMKMLF